MKFAAMEAQWETSESPAPWSAIAIIDEAQRRNTFSLEIPYVGSILAFNSLQGRYEGINELNVRYQERYGPGDYVPPVTWVYWSFRIMVGIGSCCWLTAVRRGCSLWWRPPGEARRTRWYLRLLVYLIPLPWIANFTGWITTEMGRQPVHGLRAC
jgi:cytochrome d ubiquinol oxidase subunit I